MSWTQKLALLTVAIIAISVGVAATRHPAELFRLTDRGSLEPGMVADAIAVRSNSLNDISDLTRVVFVLNQGRVVRSQ